MIIRVIQGKKINTISCDYFDLKELNTTNF
jgi:hypothetical protein